MLGQQQPRKTIRLDLRPWVSLGIVVVCVLLSHVAAVRHCALPVFGYDGAEYIEHKARDPVARQMRAVPLVRLPVVLPRVLYAEDAFYPPLLHALAGLWGLAFGQGIPAAVHVNILFVVMLAVAVALGARRLPRLLGENPSSWWSASLAASTVLLTPAVYGSARRYYYDLPMTAWIAVAFAAFCHAPMSSLALAVGTLASACALMTKWTAGLALIPLWGVALFQAFRETSSAGRRRGLRRLAVAGLAVVVLCLPVLCNSAILRTIASPALECVGFELEPRQVPSESSFDIALGQAHPPGTEDHPFRVSIEAERLRFYAAGLLHSVFGPMLSLALLGIVVVGWSAWRFLLLTLALCVPMILVLVSPTVGVVDERFLLPTVPLLVAGSCSMWDRCRLRTPVLGAATLLLAAGLVQLAAWDGRLPLGSAWTGRSSFASRGWSRLADTGCSLHEEYREFGQQACAAIGSGGEVIASDTAQRHIGIRWMLEGACAPAGVRWVTDEVAAERLARAHLEPTLSRPLAIVVSRNFVDPVLPEPLCEVRVPEDWDSPEDSLGLYVFPMGSSWAPSTWDTSSNEPERAMPASSRTR